ncbi:MAG: hypothetical protein CO141_01410 [Candidatus Moranbacteria bacterium CG_4_9_14_3_um_filter_42_9]|nr:MAG: hypothetical protein CO141_01410 [Candidatus Moranbacteria bacterium CG_4_9_14_3_um_filter_42_9]
MDRKILEKYYIKEKKSVSAIAKILQKSETGINYWIKKYKIEKRTISEAVYLKNNPNGDPFKIKNPKSLYLSELKGIGLGLYWGEGNKKNKNSIKLANTDPDLIKKFIEFLVKILGFDKNSMKFSLQVFGDINSAEAKNYWINQLKIKPGQFCKKVTITKSGKAGTYRGKNKHGVLTIYCHNTKLRNIIVNMLPL